RRHTRSKRDWSSDVCSSDLTFGGAHGFQLVDFEGFGRGVLGRRFLHQLGAGEQHRAMVHRTVRESSFSGAGKLRGAARLVADVIGITRPAERGDRRSGRLGLLDLPFISDFRARRRNGPGYGKPRQPLFPDLLLLGSKTVEAGDFFRKSFCRDGEFDGRSEERRVGKEWRWWWTSAR